MRNAKIGLTAIFSHLPGEIRAPLERAAPFYRSDAQEIILRSGRPIVIERAEGRSYLTSAGILTASPSASDLLRVTHEQIITVLHSICAYSLYARQDEINRGYITIQNGVRVGVCGTVVKNNGEIVNIKDITTLSFRVAGEFPGVSEALLDAVAPLDGILVCGPPRSGKTSLIRDMARVLSMRYKVCVIDERNEITASFGGVCGYDVGYADVFVGMLKGEGVIRALRSLSPDIIICDELGDSSDADHLRYALRCGAAFVATVHARDMEDLRRREVTADLLSTGAFRYIVMLEGGRSAGRIKRIYELRDVGRNLS